MTRINRLPYLPEGAVAAGFVRKIINEKKLAMPICNGVYRILNRELTPQEFAKEFLSSLSSRNKQA